MGENASQRPSLLHRKIIYHRLAFLVFGFVFQIATWVSRFGVFPHCFAMALSKDGDSVPSNMVGEVSPEEEDQVAFAKFSRSIEKTIVTQLRKVEDIWPVKDVLPVEDHYFVTPIDQQGFLSQDLKHQKCQIVAS